MRKLTNLSSLRNAARQACAERGVSMTDPSVWVFCLGFSGVLDGIAVTNVSLFYHNRQWYYDDYRCFELSGTYECFDISTDHL